MENTPKTKKFVEIKNIVLDEEALELRAEKITQVISVKHKIHSETLAPIKIKAKDVIEKKVEPLVFSLQEVTPEELVDIRYSKKPSFVLKKDGKYYHTYILRSLTVNSSVVGKHKCATAGKECKRLSALEDKKGGCAKVRGRSIGIEKFPFITYGYETFYTHHNSFVVLECSQYEGCPPRETKSPAEIKRIKSGLADFINNQY